MNDNSKELILMEECAEKVQQVISKVLRFGIDVEYKYNNTTNKSRLEEEIRDLLCCVELMQRYGLIDEEHVKIAKYNKVLKLKTWSSLDL
jgi:hypothetical protein